MRRAGAGGQKNTASIFEFSIDWMAFQNAAAEELSKSCKSGNGSHSDALCRIGTEPLAPIPHESEKDCSNLGTSSKSGTGSDIVHLAAKFGNTATPSARGAE